jgi:nitrate reductase gamma subunit
MELNKGWVIAESWLQEKERDIRHISWPFHKSVNNGAHLISHHHIFCSFFSFCLFPFQSLKNELLVKIAQKIPPRK